MSGLEISSFVHLGWKNRKRAEARFLFLVEAPSPALPQNWEGSRVVKDHKISAIIEDSIQNIILCRPTYGKDCNGNKYKGFSPFRNKKLLSQPNEIAALLW